MPHTEAQLKAREEQSAFDLTDEQTSALVSLYSHGTWPHGAVDSKTESLYEQLTTAGLVRHGRRVRMNGRTHFSFIPALSAA